MSKIVFLKDYGEKDKQFQEELREDGILLFAKNIVGVYNMIYGKNPNREEVHNWVDIFSDKLLLFSDLVRD